MIATQNIINLNMKIWKKQQAKQHQSCVPHFKPFKFANPQSELNHWESGFFAVNYVKHWAKYLR